MNYERLRRNIECSLLSILTEAAGSVLSIQQSKDSSGEIIKLVKAEIESADLSDTLTAKLSMVKTRSLMLQVNGIFQKWLNDSSVCCTNSEDKRNFYNEYWQEIVDIVKQFLRS